MKEYSINGKRSVFYTLGDVAKECRKSILSLRRWERLGVLPKATFKYKSKRLYNSVQKSIIVKWVKSNKVKKGIFLADLEPISFNITPAQNDSNRLKNEHYSTPL